MSYVLTIIVFILIFSFLILIHELGHFWMAKKAGIKVEEFGFGLPPRLWGKKKGDTIYSVNWIPFGGFVRMYGEDSTDSKVLKSKKSFSGKPMRARVKVIVAGVLMNFLVAWVLMAVGFTVGMQPLLGPDDVLGAINKGQVVLETGLKIREMEEGSLAQRAGFKKDDSIYAIDGVMINDFLLAEMQEDVSGTYSVSGPGGVRDVVVTQDQLPNTGEKSLGLTFYDYSPFPRVKIFELEKHLDAYVVGLRPGDIILKINGQQVYSVQEFEALTRGLSTLEFEIYRNGIVEIFLVERDEARKVVVSDVLSDSPAKMAGLQSEDIILAVNGKAMNDSLELIEFVGQHANEKLAFAIQRGDERLFYEIAPDTDARIGVLLSELVSYGVDQGMSLYNVGVLSSVTEIKDEQYPFYIAIYKALGETYRLSKLTVGMLGDFINGLVSTGEISQSVAGPVGIAQMTHVFVQEGFIPVLRFVAILSLSLAVINILPFPALDGGRLLFIIIEFVMGRRVPEKWEAYIHAFGYILILFLILAVTYSDILRLIASN